MSTARSVKEGGHVLRSDDTKILWKWAAIAKQMTVHSRTAVYTQNRMMLKTGGMRGKKRVIARSGRLGGRDCDWALLPPCCLVFEDLIVSKGTRGVKAMGQCNEAAWRSFVVRRRRVSRVSKFPFVFVRRSKRPELGSQLRPGWSGWWEEEGRRAAGRAEGVYTYRSGTRNFRGKELGCLATGSRWAGILC